MIGRMLQREIIDGAESFSKLVRSFLTEVIEV